MIPADQEFTHQPEIGQHGDCQRAVIASLLDLPISDVPHFLQLCDGDPSDYWDRLQEFCRGHGYAYLTMPARCGALFFGEVGDIYHEISGPSPRGNGVSHAVVGCNGQTIPCRDQKHAEREVKHIRLGYGLYKTRIVPPKEKSNAD